LFCERDRQFESFPLHRRVSLTGAFRNYGRKGPAGAVIEPAERPSDRRAEVSRRRHSRPRGGGQDKKLVGYFQADTGTINQLVHLWKFDDDADRRAHWAAVYANKDFVEGFALKFRPLLMTQEVKLLQAAPWGPHP
jgi:hypothetical protein